MKEDKNFEKGRKNAMIFGGAVYVGVVIAATTMFISFVLLAFPTDAYASRAVMIVSGLLVGSSMLAFPNALHKWTMGGNHRTAALILYYLEMLIIAVNTIVAFTRLLSEYSDYQMPDWAVMYEPFSIVSIIYTMFAWGTLFILDPRAQSFAKNRQFDEDYGEKIAEKTLDFLETEDGEAAIATAATKEIALRVAARMNINRDFGSHPPEADVHVAVDPAKGFVKKEAVSSTIPLTGLDEA